MMDRSYQVADTRSVSRTRPCSGITLLDIMIHSDKKCSLYCTTKYWMGHPLSDQLFSSMDAHVEFDSTIDSTDGAEGTAFLLCVCSGLCVCVRRWKQNVCFMCENCERSEGKVSVWRNIQTRFGIEDRLSLNDKGIQMRVSVCTLFCTQTGGQMNRQKGGQRRAAEKTRRSATKDDDVSVICNECEMTFLLTLILFLTISY